MYNIYVQYNYLCIGYMLCRLSYCASHVQDLDSWPHMHANSQISAVPTCTALVHATVIDRGVELHIYMLYGSRCVQCIYNFMHHYVIN